MKAVISIGRCPKCSYEGFIHFSPPTEEMMGQVALEVNGECAFCLQSGKTAIDGLREKMLRDSDATTAGEVYSADRLIQMPKVVH